MILAPTLLAIALAAAPASRLEESQVPGQFDRFVVSAAVKDQASATIIDRDGLATHLREALRRCDIPVAESRSTPRTGLLAAAVTAVLTDGGKGYALMWTLTLSADATLASGDSAFAALWQRTGVLAGPAGPSAWNEVRVALDSAMDGFCSAHSASRRR